LASFDIADPKAPKPAGFVALEGEPTSVAVANGKALVAVVTSESNDKPSGRLVVVDIASKAVESTCELGGQPDAVAFNPDKSRLAVVLENERDEELNDGELPQLPSGALAILSVDSGAADCASMRTVDLAGLAGLAGVAGDDAEPEFADVHPRRKAEPLEALLNTRGAGRDDGCGRGSGLRSATASSTAPMRSAAGNMLPLVMALSSSVESTPRA